MAATPGFAAGTRVVVAATDTAASSGGKYVSFSSQIFGGGKVHYVASLSGVGFFERADGLFTVGNNVTRRVALTGDTADTVRDLQYGGFSRLGSDRFGQTSFVAPLISNGGPAFATGLFTDDGDPTTRIITDDPTPEGTLAQLNAYGINDNGLIGLVANQRNTSGNSLTSIFVSDGGPLQTVVVGGELTSTGTFDLLSAPTPVPDDDGNVVFSATLFNNTVSSGSRGLFTGNPTVINPILITGENSPYGGTYGDPQASSFAADGSYAIVADMASSAGTTTALLRPGALGAQPVLFEGDTLRSGTSTRTIGTFGRPLAACNGKVAFVAQIAPDGTAPDRDVIATYLRGQAVEVLAADRPGTPSRTAFGKLALNDRGQLVALQVRNDSKREVLWFFDPVIGLLEVDRVTTAASGVRKLFFEDRAATMDGLGDDGQVVYVREFDMGRQELMLWTPPNLADLLPADANMDGTVSILDFAILRNNFGNPYAFFTTGDFNGDGIVSILDFAILRSNFGGSAAQLAAIDAWAQSVPEPSGVAGLAVVGFLLRRRR